MPLSAALVAQLRSEAAQAVAKEQEQKLEAAVEEARRSAAELLERQLAETMSLLELHTQRARDAEARELALKRRTVLLEEERLHVAERIRLELEEELSRQAQARVDAAVAAARERADMEMHLLQQQLAEQRERAATASSNELELRRRLAQLEDRARELDLEVTRRVDAERRSLEESIRKAASDEQALKLQERDHQIASLKRVIDELKRKSEQGSQEAQGEVLELDLQAALERKFPLDEIRPVPKGTGGADLIHEVRNVAGQPCGRIVWETKNTRHWSQTWVTKLKDDARRAGGSIAVIVSVALPDGVHELGMIDGVWVASPRTWPALALALRENLVQVAFAHAAHQGKSEKMEALYRYLSGDQFRGWVQGIVDTFAAQQEQLNRERRAMERLWKEREKQIERVVENTVCLYGEMRGIVGAGLPEISQLTLEGVLALQGGEAA